MGIYTTVCDAEIKQKRDYKFFNRLITGCLGLQIVVAAALTALGAANGSRSAVTVFGAINTVIAGFLTYLKGTGLPNRLKYFQHEWGKIREYIEQKERDFAFGQPGVSVNEEIQTIRQMYDDVRADVELNTPDRFVSVRGIGRNGPLTISQPGALSQPPVAFNPDSYISNGKSWLNEKETLANTAAIKVQGQAQGMFANLGHLKEVLEDKVKDIAHMEKEIESNGRNMVHEKKHSILGQIQSAVKEVQHLGQEIEQKAKEAAHEKELEARHAVDQSQQAARAGLAQQKEALNAQRDAINASIVAKRLEADNAIQVSSDAARDGFTQQRDAVGNVLAEKQHQAERAIDQSTDTARAALAQQRDALNAGLAQQRDALNTGLSQQQDALDHGLTQQRETLNTSLGGSERLVQSRPDVPHQ